MFKRAKLHTTQLLRANALKIVVGVVILIVALGVLFTMLVPSASDRTASNDFVSTNFDGTSTDFSRVRYTGPNRSIPAQLPITNLLSLQNLRERFVDSMVVTYQLEPIDEEELLWVGPNYSLAHDATNNLLTVTKNEPSEFVGNIDESRALESANNVVAQLFTQEQGLFSVSTTQYLTGDFHLTPSSKSQASYVQYEYAPMLAGAPLFFEKNAFPWITVLVSGNGEVQKIDLVPLVPNLNQPNGEFETIQPTEAVASINNNQASIITVSDFSQQVIDLNKVVVGELPRFQLEYRLSSATPVVLPFYRFFGTITTGDNNTMRAEIIVPALKNPPVYANPSANQP